MRISLQLWSWCSIIPHFPLFLLLTLNMVKPFIYETEYEHELLSIYYKFIFLFLI